MGIHQLFSLLRGGMNPQSLALNLLQQQASTNPMAQNLLNLTQSGDTAQIEQIARNVMQSRGLDYDTEFNSFKQLLGIK